MPTEPMSFATPPRRSGLRSLILLGVLAFAAGIAVSVALVRYYASWIAPAPHPAQQVAAPTTTAEPGSIFQPPPETDAAQRTPDEQALMVRLDTLGARLHMLETRAALIDQDSRNAAADAGRAESLLVTFAARRAIDRGLQLGYLENQLKLRFGASQPGAVATIIDAAHNPVTIEDLRLSLDTIAPELANGGTRDGWWASLRREMSSLIVIRKAGTPSPLPADRLQRIRRMLDARQVEAALAEVNRMPGTAQAGAWIAAAKRFIDAHRALDLIETVAVLGPGVPDPEAMMPQRAGQRPATPAAIPSTTTTSAP